MPVQPPPEDARALLAFWQGAGRKRWFAKNAAFDERLRDDFLTLHEQAARGELAAWAASADGALALVLLLDQFPRNAFRGTPRMYATDTMARTIAATAIDAAHDLAVAAPLRLFFYLPFEHSEELADQERSVALMTGLGERDASQARRHRDIVRRFGRFPHRNPILGRTTTAQEQAFLDAGGFAG